MIECDVDMAAAAHRLDGVVRHDERGEAPDVTYVRERTCRMVELAGVDYPGVADGGRRCDACGAIFLRSGSVDPPGWCPSCGARVVGSEEER